MVAQTFEEEIALLAENKVVVLGTNYYIGLGTIRCFRKAGVTVVAADYDRRSYGMRSKYVNERLWLSDYKREPAKVVEQLISYAKQQTAKPVIIPTHDNYLLFLDKYQAELRPYYLMSLPEQGLATKVVEKDSLYALAKQYGCLFPPTLDVDDENLYTKAANELAYPLIVKPIDSPAFTARFRCKSFVCENETELKSAIEKVKAAKIPCCVQKIIVGNDENMLLFDAYVQQNSEIKHVFTGSKLRQWPINFGASCLMYQHYIPELVEVGKKFLSDIKWRGFAEIEFKRDDRDGKIYLIEINARITNFNACIAACGINVPLLTYEDLVGLPLTPAELEIKEDLHIGFKYGYEDFLAKRAYYKSNQWTKEHLKQQEEGITFVRAIFAKDDWLPTWQFVWNKIRKKLGI